MKTEWLLCGLGLLALTQAGCAWFAKADAPAPKRPVPDFGLMLNSDGDLTFRSTDPAEAERMLRDLIGSLEGTPVKTLMYSVGAGSDIMYYPTKVASTWGWRETPKYAGHGWPGRIACGRACAAAGLDGPRIVGEVAKRLGMNFVPSLRMNDDHFSADPLHYPLTGEWWMEHHEGRTIGVSPVDGYDYSNLLDYSHREVRDFRLAQINEIVGRYQDLMDGIELDFNRTQIFFPPGTAAERGHLITELVATVRKQLDEVGGQNGRTYYLFVRVPPALRNCHWSGLEVERWMADRLVDVVSPAQLMTLAHCMPVDGFSVIAHPAGCKVYPSLYGRTNYTYPFTFAPTAESFGDPVSRAPSAALFRGVKANYLFMRAGGFQLYNFGFPSEDDDRYHEIVASLAGANAVGKELRIYAITPAYFQDHQDTYQYKKQLPFKVRPGTAHPLTLIVGEDTTATKPARCLLRLGLHNTQDADLSIEVMMNGRMLHSGTVGDRLVPITGPERGNWSGDWQYFASDGPRAYVHLAVDPAMVTQGTNQITVKIDGLADKARIVLFEVQLGIE